MVAQSTRNTSHTHTLQTYYVILAYLYYTEPSLMITSPLNMSSCTMVHLYTLTSLTSWVDFVILTHGLKSLNSQWFLVSISATSRSYIGPDIDQYYRVNIVLGTSKPDMILSICIGISQYLKPLFHFYHWPFVENYRKILYCFIRFPRQYPILLDSRYR